MKDLGNGKINVVPNWTDHANAYFMLTVQNECMEYSSDTISNVTQKKNAHLPPETIYHKLQLNPYCAIP